MKKIALWLTFAAANLIANDFTSAGSMLDATLVVPHDNSRISGARATAATNPSANFDADGFEAEFGGENGSNFGNSSGNSGANSAANSANSAANSDGFDAEFGDLEAEFQEAHTSDPLSGYNRFMTGFNDIFYNYALTPVAKGYDAVIPDPIQGAFSNFFKNLMYPVRLTNNLLQGKWQNSWDETKRFAINTTIGFAGLSDAASMHFDIPAHNEDFGQTLGHWGVGAGPHIVWPILGPSNLRDSVGMVGDFFTNPLTYAFPHTDGASTGIKAFSYFNEYSLDPEAYKKLSKDAIDLYPMLRDAYEQRRNYLIKE